MRYLSIFAVILFASFLLFAQDNPSDSAWESDGNVLQQFHYSDNGKIAVPLYNVDGKTPLPDSCLIEIAVARTPNTVDFWNDPHGPQLRNRWGGYSYVEHYTNGTECGTRPGFFWTDFFIWLDPFNSAAEPSAHCKHKGDTAFDQIYIRLYNASTAEKATHYRLSDFYDAPEAGIIPFETELSNWSNWKPIPPKK